MQKNNIVIIKSQEENPIYLIENVQTAKNSKSYFSIYYYPKTGNKTLSYRLQHEDKNSKYLVIKLDQENTILEAALDIYDQKNNKTKGNFRIHYFDGSYYENQIKGCFKITFTTKKGIKNTIATQKIKGGSVTLNNLTSYFMMFKDMIDTKMGRVTDSRLYDIKETMNIITKIVPKSLKEEEILNRVKESLNNPSLSR